MGLGMSRVGTVVAGIVVVVCLHASPSRAAVILTFEDVFGPCPADGSHDGPHSATIQGVTFTAPGTDILQNYGKLGQDYSQPTTPFDSDWLCFFANEGGATLTFPEPITSVAFDTGIVSFWGDSSFQVSGGFNTTTFTESASPLRHINRGFTVPVTTVTFKWVENSGAHASLGIDNLAYTVVPEPATIALAAASLLPVLLGRRREC